MQPIQRVAALTLGLAVLYFLAVRYNPSSATSGTRTPHSGGQGQQGKGDESVYRKRLVAIGDLHGGQSSSSLLPAALYIAARPHAKLIKVDLEHARKILHLAGIIDTEGNWAGGDDILVQTGDIVDRGTYAWDIYRMMQSLRGQASGQGGRVVSVLGNHEVMNAIGDWRYVQLARLVPASTGLDGMAHGGRCMNFFAVYTR